MLLLLFLFMGNFKYKLKRKEKYNKPDGPVTQFQQLPDRGQSRFFLYPHLLPYPSCIIFKKIQGTPIIFYPCVVESSGLLSCMYLYLIFPLKMNFQYNRDVTFCPHQIGEKVIASQHRGLTETWNKGNPQAPTLGDNWAQRYCWPVRAAPSATEDAPR